MKRELAIDLAVVAGFLWLLAPTLARIQWTVR
jgi:hypothetical protein